MNWTIAIAVIIGWTLSTIVDYSLGAFIFRNNKPVGQIVINMEDPMKDTYTLELFIPLGELNTRTNVNLMIKKEDQ